MGEVYRGEQISLKRPVAIKLLRIEAGDASEMLQRFEREAQVLSRLRHPSIAGVVDFGRADGVPYLVMELVEGRSLDEALAEGAALPPLEAAPILIQIARALEHAHSQGVIHRDLKPSNILIHGNDARLIDFGIARLLSDESSPGNNLTATGMVVGTPRYASPEQAMGLPLDFRSDLYSLGVVAYRMLAGNPPFDADTPAAVLTMHATVRPPALLTASGLSASAAGLCAIIDRLLEKQPQDRFASATAVAEALEEWFHEVKRTQGAARMAETAVHAEGEPEASGTANPAVPTENLAIIFTELEGWTERLAKLSYDQQAQLVAVHDAVALPVVSALGGRRVKSIQETQLYRFPSPTRAVHAAMAMIDRSSSYNQGAPASMQLTFRIGIAAGEVRVEEGDVFGEPVNVAARVKALAAFGEILLAQSVYLAMNKSEAPTAPVGQRTLKGIPDPVMIHRVERSEEGALPYGGVILRDLKLPEVRAENAVALARGWKSKLKLSPPSSRGWRPAAIGVVALAVVIAALALWPSRTPEIELPEVAVKTRALIEAGKARAAIDALEAVVESNQADPALHAALAHAYVHGGRKPDALPHYAWAAKKNPQGFDRVYVRDLLVLVGMKGSSGQKAGEILTQLGPPGRAWLEEIAAAETDEELRSRAKAALGDGDRGKN